MTPDEFDLQAKAKIAALMQDYVVVGVDVDVDYLYDDLPDAPNIERRRRLTVHLVPNDEPRSQVHGPAHLTASASARPSSEAGDDE